MEPVTRKEFFLAKAAGQATKEIEPITREEMFLQAIAAVGGNGSDVYSTDEIAIGTWIDGRPLYRRVDMFEAEPNARVNHPVPGVNVVGYSSFANYLSSANPQLFSDAFFNLENEANIWTEIARDGKDEQIFVFCSNFGNSSFLVTVILMYTKKEDSATVEIPDVAAMNAAYEEGVQSA